LARLLPLASTPPMNHYCRSDAEHRFNTVRITYENEPHRNSASGFGREFRRRAA
jgi:hypothetical protein